LLSNPDFSFRICILDAKGESLFGLSEFDLIPVSELGLEMDTFYKLALMLDEEELTYAIQPWLLSMVLNEGHPHALYLAPEVFVYSDLKEVARCSLKHPVTLVPNLLESLPSDSYRPSELEMLNGGAFQSGVVAVGPESTEFLEWWKRRVEIDPSSRLDSVNTRNQRWLDLVPGMWDTKIIKDPGYNVGFWNVAQRSLSTLGDEILVKGHPLKFFNFNGFDPESPWVLTPEIGDETRLWPSQNSVLSRICDDYATNLLSNPESSPDASYGFASLDGHGIVSKSFRTAFRSLASDPKLDKADSIPVPFVGQDGKVVEFTTKKVPGSDCVTTPMLSLWRQRRDLQLAFPDLMGVDGPSYLNWARTSGIREGQLLEKDIGSLFENYEHLETSNPPIVSEELGVNLVGYLTSELGLGELARLVFETVENSGISIRTVVSNRNKSRKSIEHAISNPHKVFPINLAVLTADQMTNWKELEQFSEFSNLPTIGVWAWELEDFPKGFENVFDFVDEIWTISEFSRKSIQQVTEKPVYVIPLPSKPIQGTVFETPQFSGLDLSKTDYFLSMFDYQSSIERKNPMAVIDAFREAFQDDEGVRLVIKTVNGDLWPTQRERLTYLTRNYKNITLIDAYLKPGEVRGLMQSALAYVSLHRSEGYGLTCAEAMALGTPVIATGYSGNLDFMNEENSLLVDYELIPVNDPTGTYTVDSKWADPKIDSAAKHMKRIHNDKPFAKRIGLEGMESIKRSSSFESAAEFARERLLQFHLRAVERSRRIQMLANEEARKKSIKRKISSLIPSRLKNGIRHLFLD
jgi:glycosyltransferase involved in cell wall biosynthesis